MVRLDRRCQLRDTHGKRLLGSLAAQVRATGASAFKHVCLRAGDALLRRPYLELYEPALRWTSASRLTYRNGGVVWVSVRVRRLRSRLWQAMDLGCESLLLARICWRDCGRGMVDLHDLGATIVLIPLMASGSSSARADLGGRCLARWFFGQAPSFRSSRVVLFGPRWRF